tara:strand:+ start:1749 stop:1925 length:177 start_codon:yes stop_codon:yes gene_type:complete
VNAVKGQKDTSSIICLYNASKVKFKQNRRKLLNLNGFWLFVLSFKKTDNPFMGQARLL